ncbi:MAG: hypothetical protein A2W80_06205 [Candidatus Riflebacteria bacterium GWC2_50_8]|nr:MAG: hypothetical protein A2W80_06205 [Candidatus Riflebacteria bacterium GWC2_50_8]
MPESSGTTNTADFAAWVASAIDRCRPDKLIIDAFPGGIIGELCGLEQLKDIECSYIARILDLPAYQKRLCGNLPRIKKIYRVEKLGEDHERFLNSLNAPIENLALRYDSDATATVQLPDNCWLVVHSGNNEELLQLWLFARQTADIENVRPRLAMVSPGPRPQFLPPEALHFAIYPADELLVQAGRVFSAAGFNIMQQMRCFKAKHRVLPMKRALDNQFLRHQFWRENN